MLDMLKRFVEEKLQKNLKIMPVTLIRGARQAGKTTLIHEIKKQNGYTFYSLDDQSNLANARNDPSGWIKSMKKPCIIDEVQRAPEIFLPIKADVDENRIPGRYILTGSANPLLLPKMGDSLAGRMGILDLYPFSQSEIQQKQGSFIETIFQDELSPHSFPPLSKEELNHLLVKGGYPFVQTLDSAEREIWMGAYLQTILDRDVRDISNIEGLRDFSLLFQLLASRSANLLNLSDISRSLSISNPTLKRYTGLLEALFFVHLLPGWYSNLGKRIVKSPKVHICDTGIISYLLSVDEKKLERDLMIRGSMIETFVFTEILKLQSFSSQRFKIYHFRDGTHEVDFVLEKPDGTIVGIEVKSGEGINSNSLKGLKHLKSITKKKFLRGLVLYQGDQMGCYDQNLWTIPIQALWEW